MKNNKGKGIILGLSSLLYAILRMADIISNPIYILDIFMMIEIKCHLVINLMNGK